MFEDNIINGDDFWSPLILAGMKTCIFSGEKYNTYTGIPVSLYDALQQNAKRIPNKCFIVDDTGNSFTYSEFLNLVDDFSRVLFRQYHVKQGSHVALLLFNRIEFCVSFFAILRLRGIVVPLPTKYRKDEIFSLIDKSDLSGIICDEKFYGWFGEHFEFSPYFLIKVCTSSARCALPLATDEQLALPQALQNIEDISVIMFTSGTTSHSKGVMITNYNIMHAIAVYQKIFQITENDSSIISIPIYHVTGLIALLGLFTFSGGCIYLHKSFDADRILMDIKKYQITFLHGSPTVFSILMSHAKKHPSPTSIRILACGSSNMPKAKILELHSFMPQMKFFTVYGLTETASPATIFPGDAATSNYIGSCGHPIPGISFQIQDESGHALPAGVVGSILIKGTVVLKGYYHLDTDLFKNGWLDTGDLGYFNQEGYLYVVDRKKDMINRGGEKVCSFDVENLLYEIDKIHEAAVVGIPDAIYGEVPSAMVTLEPGSTLSPDEIRQYLKGKLASFQIPVKILIADTLPLTANSKIDKKKIKEILTHSLLC